ncbi:hypothetical protein DFH27DRAFT_16488 [Peziza echinospora]|nr:hypothetical protein DFH27DRAFT_16488 [Peziza echinospora]
MPKPTGRPSRSASRKSTPFKNQTSANSATPHPAAGNTKATEKAPQKPRGRAKALKGTEEPLDQPEWVEPPLAEARASYKEYDINTPPNPSTAMMQPLGTLPSAKILGKQHGTKQKGMGKSTLANGSGKNMGAPEAKEGARSFKTMANATPFIVEAVVASPAPPSPTVELRRFTFPDAPEEFPSTKTEVGRQKLSAVVQAAVDRSAQVGMEVLGKAIQRLYEDSMENVELGELLDAVLAQKATAEQTVAFQAHIRTARESLEQKSSPTPNGTNPSSVPIPTITKATLATGLAIRKGIAPESAKDRKGRRTSRRIQESIETALQEATSDLSTISSSGSNLDNPPFPGGPSEPSPPPAPVTQNHDKTKQPTKVLNETTSAEMDLRYEQASKVLKEKMPKENSPVPESFIRYSEEVEGDDARSVDAAATGVAPPTRGPVRKEATNPRKRPRSPDPPSTPPPLGPPSAITMLEPLELGGPPKKKRQTRVKTSPIKNKTGPFVLAGTGNPPADSSSRGARYASEAVSENDDLCCVCNGPGKFLCCDRCPKSFHFTCINPPIDENNIPEDSWYCNKCTSQMNPRDKQPRGLFGMLLEDIERKNPVSFSLPESIKTYFQGVQSGSNGEYMELQDNKPLKRGGFVEELDHYRTKDKNGQSIFCYKCGLSSLGQKKIISCDFCPLYWHLDCLNPPLANPPAPARKWMCPAHAEQGLLQPRRPRNAKVVDTFLRRGHRNNGYIEIENSESEDEMQFHEHEQGGVIYRLPERGIKLDFIDKIRAYNNHASTSFDRKTGTYKRRRIGGESTVAASRELSFLDEDTITEPSIVGRSTDDTDIIRTLLLLGQRGETELKNPQTAEDLSVLYQTLVTEAPAAVQALLRGSNDTIKNKQPTSHGNPEQPPFSPAESTDSPANFPDLERKQLQALLELCQKRIAILDSRDRELGV